MLPSVPGGLVKLMILSFSDDKRNKSNGPPYIALINPTSFRTGQNIAYSSRNQGQGSTPPSQLYLNTLPKTMKFDFLFDTTGAIVDLNPGAVFQTLDQQISNFLKYTFDYSGEAHRIPFLQVVWGPTIFTGTFQNISVEYKLFDPTGMPIRAVLHCCFLESPPDTGDDDADTQQSSPDLTHSRVVVAGDTLPLLCNEIYEDSSYYLQVALVNNIANFRKLQVGSTIYFPPLA
jgi:contractile injection system tube protein